MTNQVENDKQTITVTVELHMDGETRTYQSKAETLNRARFLAEKKARAFLRRKNLSVKMDNIIKERCPDCPTLTTITVYDLEVPPRKVDELDDLDWLLEVSM